MSLLLDALKKAAEQKAAKSRQEEAETSSSDQTEVTVAGEDISALEDSADDNLQHSRRDVGDDTEIEEPDSTITQTSSPGAQMQTGEDETIVFAEEDVSDFLGEPELVNRDTKSHDDATDLDQTEYQTHHELGEAKQSGDATEIDQTEHQTHHEAGEVERPGDDTEIDQTEYQTHHELGEAERSADATEIDQTEHQTHHEAREVERPGDDTELDQTEYQTHHEAVEAERSGDATEIDQTEYQTHHAPGEAEQSGDDTELQQDASQDEDLSLLLVEHDDTNLTSRTSLTDPQTSQDMAQATDSDGAGMEDDLALVDTTVHQMPADVTETAAATQTNATTGIASVTQTTPGTLRPIDSTSTQTYAPDNYDRTLMKLPSDDASRIFAGMKSDSDAVMTPDYAKKVFRSKSSAQRMQAYKVYSGIAVVILLSIGIFGAFEFQDESDSIDSSLQPLKRDPMPGIIKPEDINKDASLFADSGANARTIEIIESAGNASETVVADEGVIAEEAAITDEAATTDETMATDDAAIVASVAEIDNSAVASAAPVQAEPVVTTQVASIDQKEATAIQSTNNSSTLEIISSSQIEQKDLWLREAYNAYKSGNYNLAMTRYNQVLEVDPGNRNALLARAAINVQNGNSNAAIKDYQTLLLRNPKDSLAMTSLIAVANYSPQDTETQLKLMIRDEPDSPYLNFALANAYGAQNRWQEAQGHYFKALENNPGDPNYAYNLAVSLEHIAQPLAAVSYYQRALDNINNGLAIFNREVVSQRMETLAKQ
jgi:tetratricopeptide (TPR) repeat protein